MLFGIDRLIDETTLLEPVRGASRQYEQALDAHGSCARFDAFQELLAVAPAPVVRMDRHAGQFGLILAIGADLSIFRRTR